jgi:hypothetical protein
MGLRTVYGWVGDSGTEGFRDGTDVSCNGVPGRLLRLEIEAPGPLSTIHLNHGASGMMVPQYIAIAKGIIGADPRVYTAIMCSIWSPNGPAGEPAEWAARPENLAAMLVALQDFEAWLLARSKVFIPVFMMGSAFDLGVDQRVRMQGHIDACTALWPWLLNLNTPIQDPAYTDGPRMLIPTYCEDGTHQNQAGFTAQAAYVRPLIPAALAAAATHYGFTGL